jgi:hypothetical protein
MARIRGKSGPPIAMRVLAEIIASDAVDRPSSGLDTISAEMYL